MISLTQAVILCGGRGTRLGRITDHLPKPMVPILGRPFLEYLLDQLRRAGLSEVVLLTGYLGDQIQTHFGDGHRFGITVRYSAGPAEWETGQRLWEARQLLQSRFLLMYGDNFTPFRPGPICRQHESSASLITLTVARKERGNIRLGSAGEPSPIRGRVDLYDPSRQATGLTHVEIGYMLVERDPVLPMLEGSRESFSLVLEKLAGTRRLGVVEQADAYHSVSDPERWKKTEAYLRAKQIILLDRDGVINRKAPRWQYVAQKEDVVWIPETLQAMEELACEGFEFMVLSNQAGIGRGVVEQQAVDDLHAWMTEQLGRRGIVLRDILICPHHWDAGCLCRKPEAGLFLQVSRKHSLRLDRTIYVGDDIRDADAANRAGCSCLLVGEAVDLKREGEEGVGQVDNPSYDVPIQHAATMIEGLPWIREQFALWEAPSSRATRSPVF